MSKSSERLLREYLYPRAEILKLQGVPYPWPEDIEEADRWLPPVVLCKQCHQDVTKHRRCSRCSFLLGPGHLPIHPRRTEMCQGCGDWVDASTAAVLKNDNGHWTEAQKLMEAEQPAVAGVS